MSIFTKLFNFTADPLKTYGSELATINGYKDEITELTQEQIKSEIEKFQIELKNLSDETEILKKLHEIRPRVFALVRESAMRTIGQFHYDVQIIGGIALSERKIAEMKTGEGKTLTATLPLVLFALAGKGAHLVTVNDYLARWQASLLGPVFSYLGLSVSSIQHQASFTFDPEYKPDEEEIERLQGEVEGLVMDVKHMKPITRKQAYSTDITYGTNNEFGFDYLRDNMAPTAEQISQRDLFFVIIDEVDSILIDEARTPLIISQPDSDPTEKYTQFAHMVNQLNPETDFKLEEKHKAVSLTEDGINKVEEMLNVENIYDTSQGIITLHHIEQAVRALMLFKKDRDYVVRDGEVVIVDEFTGRMMFGRRYSEGLHQAIEAKEKVKIQQESKTLATITFQNLFRLYTVLSGMTGTAKTEEEEFYKIYQLEVVILPTNKPLVREDLADQIYKTEEAKFKAIATEVRRRHNTGQPILIGTVSIAKNEMLAESLKNEGLQFELLNAKQHEREASIVAQAGRLGAITVATNIAGRGVDILLGGNPVDPEEAERVKQAGGLHVLGTERHESRRIDNQLRGRSGRQGDPGSTQFFVSMEDDLMRLFGGDRMKNMMSSLGIEDDQPIEAKLVSRSIESAQKKIEGMNFDSRKNVLEFDDVLNLQRIKIYKRRRALLQAKPEENDSLKAEFKGMIDNKISAIVSNTFNVEEDQSKAIQTILESASTIMPLPENTPQLIDEAINNGSDREFVVMDILSKQADRIFDEREEAFGKDNYENVLRYISLQSIDSLWMEHLDTMDHLRDSVRLRGYGQRDPLVEYKREGFNMFNRLLEDINGQIVSTILRVSPQVEQVAPAPQISNSANWVTNTSESTGSVVSASPETDPAMDGVGRNDKCPCGSGKKYKKCGLLNTSEHQKLMEK